MNDHMEDFSSDLHDAVLARLAKITALANVLMQVDPHEMAFGSLSNTAWTLVDLAEEAHDMLTGKTAVRP